MKKTEIWISGAGGYTRATDKLYLGGPADFVVHVNDKEYRMEINEHGELSMLCINGLNENIDVHNGYKRVNLTSSIESSDDYYDEMREGYKEHISLAKKCSKCDECPFAIMGSIVYPDFCSLSGNPIDIKTKDESKCIVCQEIMPE